MRENPKIKVYTEQGEMRLDIPLDEGKYPDASHSLTLFALEPWAGGFFSIFLWEYLRLDSTNEFVLVLKGYWFFITSTSTVALSLQIDYNYWDTSQTT